MYFMGEEIGTDSTRIPTELVEQRAQSSSDNRAHNGHPRITPVRRSLSLDGQKSMSQARPEIARGIDRVTGRAAQRKTNRPDEQPDQGGTKPSWESGLRIEIL